MLKTRVNSDHDETPFGGCPNTSKTGLPTNELASLADYDCQRAVDHCGNIMRRATGPRLSIGTEARLSSDGYSI